MLPDLQAAEAVQAGRMVDLDAQGAIDVLLCWQQWKLRSSFLKRVATAVLDGARTSLRQGGFAASVK